MKPRENSKNLLGVTRSKAKMYEYSVPEDHHIKITRDPSHLFPISFALLGDVAADLCRPNADQETLKNNITELAFSALFFDSYTQTYLNDELDEYLSLLAAAAYYLCDLPGSTTAILNRMPEISNDNYSGELERFLFWLLKSDFEVGFEFGDTICKKEFSQLKDLIRDYFTGKTSWQNVLNFVPTIRSKIYDIGSPRDLLLTDISLAVLLLKIRNSTRTLLPQYTDLDISTWNTILSQSSFIKELWPSQRLLGKKNVFKGASAVIQMPTSAGKSKSIELIIRSAFLSGRTKTCVVVAPFRALCREITENLANAFNGESININELSDVFQKDFDAENLVNESSFQILSVTPEKLVYVLRQTPDLAEKIGLLIFDEGHQFDNGTRGVTYELLITSLKSLLPHDVQMILISAVISNAEAIASWLLGERSQVIKDSSLVTTFRTIGFSTWTTSQGQIQYVKPNDIDQNEFFVPRVIERQNLAKRGRESKIRQFPRLNDGKTVAAHLGIKLVKNGGVAIFCGVKSTATNLANDIIKAFDRSYSMEPPLNFSDQLELTKISFLFEEHFGASSVECKAAKYGVLTHHAGIPHGLRLATENALREGHAKFIICTSTLAQGVNLPIKYLLFTNIYQAGEKLSVRNFHNLIGRAGRSGLQTEGTIIFADPEVYDKRSNQSFQSIRELFDSSKTEPCTSSLLSIFAPIRSSDKKLDLNISETDILNILEKFYKDEASLNTLISDIDKQSKDNNFNEKTVRAQFKYKLKIASSIEGYLISTLEGTEEDRRDLLCSELAKRTLAYHLASAEQKLLLEKLFSIISKNIDDKVPSEIKKASYSRALTGIAEMIEIEKWVEENAYPITLSSDDDNSLFEVLYPVIEKYLNGDTLKKIFPEGQRSPLALSWVSGSSYYEMLSHLLSNKSWLQAGSQKRRIQLSHIVDICDRQLAFDGMLTLGAIAEILESDPDFTNTTIPKSVRLLQKRIKYGLPDKLSVRVFELGFSDRVIAQKLGNYLEQKNVRNNFMLTQEIKKNIDEIRSILLPYPSYFLGVLDKFLVDD